MATDEDIEREIQAKGLTAPRVTPSSIEAKIKSEHYFTAYDGVFGKTCFEADPETAVEEVASDLVAPEALELMTFCVLVLENGFTVHGISAVASPENFDAEIGRKVARQNAVNSIWPLEGYLLRELLAEDARRETEGQ